MEKYIASSAWSNPSVEVEEAVDAWVAGRLARLLDAMTAIKLRDLKSKEASTSVI